ncbi:PREDICTED: uncharacterized protein LOC104818924 [Tarenaya hassleriana]|uniref:uncharacterized protein LOC104818924 n=1 Tax=Tarenaya hassleriana TaxID=28532 RepID=UPI00053C5E71|nr:PREDICTED: uncharacterized protein LOC104818924 [Tarenaya hassleriana]
MSKKKSSGNTMTLKDFHGGSIPSDLPLPSAPGIAPRPGCDRTSWGTSIGRSDQRTRPSSSHSIRNFDDKTPFLSLAANIGHNFSEDERKPLDGPSAPRRMVSDDVFRAPSTYVAVKSDSVLAGRLVSWQGASGPWPVKKVDASHSGICDQMIGGNSEKNSMSGSNPNNAWASPREVTLPSSESGQSPWATKPAVSKLAHVTAIEQVPSGRWHSKLVAPGQIENLKHSELENGLYKTNDNVLDRGDLARERESSDVRLDMHIEKGLGIEDGIPGGRKVSPDYEKGPASACFEVKHGNVIATRNNRIYPNHSAEPIVPSEAMERPKLKLLPRTKPLENVERPLHDAKQEIRASVVVQRENGNATNVTGKNMNILKPSSPADESDNPQAERPKLNLKPVSQLLVQPLVNPERERNAVFGGARPRELVLKERGIDETDHNESEQLFERVKPNASKTERIPDQAFPSRPLNNISREIRTGKVEKKDNQSLSNADRSETEMRNWRNNNDNNSRRNNSTRGNERHPSPETWRRNPVEEPRKPESAEGMGQRYGKAASALELALAFSKPVSGGGRGL